MSREDAQMKIRLPADLRDQIVAAAEGAKRSLNAEIVARLEQTFAANDVEIELSARVVENEERIKTLENAFRDIAQLLHSPKRTDG